MVFSNIVILDVIRVLAEASTSTTYAKLGVSFAHRMRMLKFVNNTDGDMLFALNNTPNAAPASDGTADQDIVPAGGFSLYDFTTNRRADGSAFVFPTGTQIWVRQSSTPTTGSVYAICVYAEGE